MNHYWEVTKHKAWVFWFCIKFCSKLMWRCFVHDASKYGVDEAPGFIKNTPLLKNLVYGSEEYKKCHEDLKPSLDHHYAVNRHHPEYFMNGGYRVMGALDRMEMIFDWMASVKRCKGGDILKSIDINKERFKYEDVDREWLQKIVGDVK